MGCERTFKSCINLVKMSTVKFWKEKVLIEIEIDHVTILPDFIRHTRFMTQSDSSSVSFNQ